MQQRFDEWLEAKLQERGWQAADLARASREADYPRGFDPGLISRWRKPPPLGVVPTRVTLDRLARALDVPQREAYRAAGLWSADDVGDAEEKVQTELEARLARLGTTLSKYPRAVWLAVLEANERMADALAHSAEPPVSAPEKGGVSASIQEQKQDKHNDRDPFTLRKRLAQPALA
jgi:transcriptional regulator with XRE-family HTH domain